MTQKCLGNAREAVCTRTHIRFELVHQLHSRLVQHHRQKPSGKSEVGPQATVDFHLFHDKRANVRDHAQTATPTRLSEKDAYVRAHLAATVQHDPSMA